MADALNLVDDARPARRQEAFELLVALEEGLPRPGAARVGVTGAPGAGKSTLLDALVRSLHESPRAELEDAFAFTWAIESVGLEHAAALVAGFKLCDWGYPERSDALALLVSAIADFGPRVLPLLDGDLKRAVAERQQRE